MGSAVGGLVSGGLSLAGSVLGGRERSEGMQEAAEQARFIPRDINTPIGSVDASVDNYSASLSPELQRQYEGLLGMSQQRLQAAQSPLAGFNYIRQTYQPELERQQLSQESRLLNQGLLGSTTGQLQQQGLREAQNQALLEAGLSQQQQAYEQGIGLLGSAVELGALPSDLIATSGNISNQASAAGARAGRFTAQAGADRGRQIQSIFSGLGEAAGSLNFPGSGGGVSFGGGAPPNVRGIGPSAAGGLFSGITNLF